MSGRQTGTIICIRDGGFADIVPDNDRWNVRLSFRWEPTEAWPFVKVGQRVTFERDDGWTHDILALHVELLKNEDDTTTQGA